MKTYRRILAMPVFLALLLSAASTVLADANAPDPQQAKNRDNAHRIADAGLKWLVSRQNENGSWRLDRDPDPSPVVAPTAGTALAVLSLLRQGHVPGRGEYGEPLAKGIRFIRQQMIGAETGFRSPDKGAHMYGQAIVAMALCEALDRTGDESLRPIAQGAIDFIVFAQDPDGGGWRYVPRASGDTCVVGWQLQALGSASRARLKVPKDTLTMADRFLDSTQTGEAGYYSYVPGGGPTRSMAAVGLFSRTCTRPGETPADFKRGLAEIIGGKPTPIDESNLYFDHYGMLLLHSVPGHSTTGWDTAMIQKLESSQDAAGQTAGSWFFKDVWGPQLGRLGMTCFSLLTLAQVDLKP